MLWVFNYERRIKNKIKLNKNLHGHSDILVIIILYLSLHLNKYKNQIIQFNSQSPLYYTLPILHFQPTSLFKKGIALELNALCVWYSTSVLRLTFIFFSRLLLRSPTQHQCIWFIYNEKKNIISRLKNIKFYCNWIYKYLKRRSIQHETTKDIIKTFFHQTIGLSVLCHEIPINFWF